MVLIDEGIQIDCSAEQSLNALRPRLEILQRVSKLTYERFSQQLKQESAIVLTDAGMQILESDVQHSKADSRKIEHLHPVSNVTDKMSS
jgi:hypothetical protein